MNELSLGLCIKLERIRRGVLQRRVAALSGIPATVLSEIENGWRVPTVDQLRLICEAIGIRPKDLGGDVP